jgi:hypothetical protein
MVLFLFAQNFIVYFVPGLGPINKKSQIREIFRKSQKKLNLPFLSETTEKLTGRCFGFKTFSYELN